MKTEGWEEALLDTEVLDAIRLKMRETFGYSVCKDDAELDLELVDIDTETGTIG